MLIMAVLGLPLPGIWQAARAQNPGGNWTDFVNISQTATASTFPCIIADAAGNVHVLWSEDVGGRTKNLSSNRDGTPELDSRATRSTISPIVEIHYTMPVGPEQSGLTR